MTRDIAEQDSLKRLIARLRSTVSNHGYLRMAPDGNGVLQNPDGPEAADTLSQMRDILTRLLDLEAPAEHLPEPISCDLLTLIDEASALLTTTKIEKE